MKRKLCLILACALALLWGNAAEAGQVTATGQGADERQALHQAMREAVEQEVGVYIDSRTRIENYRVLSDTVYSQSEGYIAGYEVLSHEIIGGVHRITIRANVNSELLQSRALSHLQKKALVGANMEDPRIGLLAVDKNGNSYPALENALAAALEQEGFSRLIDLDLAAEGTRRALLAAEAAGDRATLAALRTQANCDLLAIVRVEESWDSLDYVMPGLHKAYITAAARLASMATGEILWAGNAYGESSHWNAGASGEAVRKAAQSLAPRLAQAALGKAENVEQHVRLTAPQSVLGSVAEARSRLEALPGVEHAFVRSLTAGLLTIDLDFDGTAADLAATLSRAGYQVTRLEANSVTLN